MLSMTMTGEKRLETLINIFLTLCVFCLAMSLHLSCSETMKMIKDNTTSNFSNHNDFLQAIRSVKRHPQTHRKTQNFGAAAKLMMNHWHKCDSTKKKKLDAFFDSAFVQSNEA